MVARLLFPFSDSSALTSLTVLSIVVLAFPTALFFFISGLWTPRLKFVLTQILDFVVRAFAELQGICALAYAVPGWSDGAYSFLRCAEHWVWVDYFDGLVEEEQGETYETTLYQELASFRFDHWSRTYYGNGFTATSFLLISIFFALIYLIFARFCVCARRYFGFFQLDFLVKILQITHLRLSLSLLLEIRMLFDGREPHWSSGTGIGLSVVATIVLPIFLLFLVSFRKQRPLDIDTNLKTYGVLYREFSGPLRTVHFFSVFIENLILAVTLCVIGQWRDSQAYVLVSLNTLSFLYVVALRPFRLPEANVSEAILRMLRMMIGILLVLVYHREEAELQEDVENLVCFLLVLLWLVTQLLSAVLLTIVSLRHVRSFFTDEAIEQYLYDFPKLDAAQATLENIPKKSDLSPESSPLSHFSPRGDLPDVPPTALPKDSLEDNQNSPIRRRSQKSRKPREKGSTEG